MARDLEGRTTDLRPARHPGPAKRGGGRHRRHRRLHREPPAPGWHRRDALRAVPARADRRPASRRRDHAGPGADRPGGDHRARPLGDRDHEGHRQGRHRPVARRAGGARDDGRRGAERRRAGRGSALAALAALEGHRAAGARLRQRRAPRRRDGPPSRLRQAGRPRRRARRRVLRAVRGHAGLSRARLRLSHRRVAQAAGERREQPAHHGAGLPSRRDPAEPGARGAGLRPHGRGGRRRPRGGRRARRGRRRGDDRRGQDLSGRRQQLDAL